jgi:hypothetical protein
MMIVVKKLTINIYILKKKKTKQKEENVGVKCIFGTCSKDHYQKSASI